MKKNIRIFFVTNYIFFFLIINLAHASEVITETNSQVIVREHPKTGKPYVVITSASEIPAPFFPDMKKFSRPDYRLLDPNVKSGKIPYDGPYTDSKRIYIFAASVATLGTVGGALGMALVPASTGAAAAGSGGTYLAAGGAIAAGAVATGVSTTKTNPKTDNFTQASQSKSIYKETR